MKAVLFELLIVCLLGALHAEPEEMGLGAGSTERSLPSSSQKLEEPERSALLGQYGTMSQDEQDLRKRYAESTIASEISKIMDSMVQKNFVKFLLSQREKKSKLTDVEGDAEGQYNDLLELSLQEKQRGNI